MSVRYHPSRQHFLTLPVVAFSLLLLTVVACAKGGNYAFVRVADTRDGVFTLDSARRPVINNIGTVTFYGVQPGAISGYHQGNGGAINTVVSNATPGLATRTLYSPSMNESGQIAFLADDISAPDFLRVYRADPSGALTLIAHSGAGTFNSIGTHPSLNNGGGVAFQAPNGGVAVAGIWQGTGAAPPTRMYGGVGTDVTAFSSNPSLNNIGTVAFGGQYTFAFGVNAHLKGAGETPGVIADGRNDISSFQENVINDGGVVAFGATRFSAPTGIFYGSGGAVITTYADVSGPYSELALGDGANGFPSLNNPGTIAFMAKLDAGGTGIFTGSDPTTSRVIQTGSTLFGRSVEHLFSGLDREALNDAGEIAFMAQLHDDSGFSDVVVKAVPVVAQKWGADADGVWSDSSKWVGPVPNALYHTANFTDAITEPRTITVDGAYTVGSINFDNVNTYTVTGPGSITINDSWQSQINVRSGHHILDIALHPKNRYFYIGTGADSELTVSQPVSMFDDQTLDFTGPGRLGMRNYRVGELRVNSGTASVVPNGTDSGASRVGSIDFGGGGSASFSGTLDLNDNDLIVQDNSYAGVNTAIVNARHGGAWDRAGINSSSARTQVDHATTLGLLSGTEYKAIYGGAATFDGFAVAATDNLVKYTWYGDTDFNGKVDGADYARVDTTFNNEATLGNIGHWFNGDFDGNGKVDGADYAMIDSAYNAQSATLGPGGMTVPEPGCFGVCAAAMLALAPRRRAH